ncbi:MAG: ArnT family glycosyltransferase [Usitatibacter sp.]
MKLPQSLLNRACLSAVAIVLVFLAAGAVGHDPWKPDEAYTFGLVLHILQSGDWVVPMLAGEPFMEKPPLYYLTAAATARLFSPWLALHDGARLASVFYVGLAAAFAGISARRLFGPGHGHVAALLLVGSLGLAPIAHAMITDTALLAGFAIALCALTFALERPRLAGALLGTGVGVGFMSKGLVEPAMVGGACLALLAFARYRSRAYARCLLWAALFALPWLALWPALLHHRSPALFMRWFWDNNLGRYFGFVRLGAQEEPWFYARTLGWFTFPAGVVAVAAVIAGVCGADERFRAALEINAAVILCIVVVLGTSATARALYALPLLLPLAILGSSVVDRIPVRAGMAASALLAAATLGALAFAWWVWWRAIADGSPPAMAFLTRLLPAQFEFPFDLGEVLAAGAITVAWLLMWTFRRVSWLHLWSANVAVIWGVYMTLLLPWIDNAKSFREPFAQLSSHLKPAGCVASVGLGEPQRAMLHYVAGVTTSRSEVDPRACRYVVIQSSRVGTMPALPDGEWEMLWEGARPGERFERFQLWESPDAEPEHQALLRPASGTHLGHP